MHMAEVKLTAEDRAILNQLFKNGRASINDIARNARISKETCRYRLKRLHEEGVLVSVTPILNYNAFHKSVYRIQIRLYNTAPLHEKKILEKCKELPNIAWIVDLSGSWDIALLFLCTDTYEFEKSIQSTYALFGDIIEKVSTSIITQIEYLAPNLFTDVESTSVIVGYASKKYDLHTNELKIVEQLIDDGRKSVLDIAKDTGMSATNATHHLKQLQHKKIIVGYRPILDYSKLGLDHFKVMLSLRNPSDKGACLELLKKSLDVLYITSSIADYDIEFEALASSMRSLLLEIENLKTTIPIKSFEVILTISEKRVVFTT